MVFFVRTVPPGFRTSVAGRVKPFAVQIHFNIDENGRRQLSFRAVRHCSYVTGATRGCREHNKSTPAWQLTGWIVHPVYCIKKKKNFKRVYSVRGIDNAVIFKRGVEKHRVPRPRSPVVRCSRTKAAPPRVKNIITGTRPIGRGNIVGQWFVFLRFVWCSFFFFPLLVDQKQSKYRFRFAQKNDLLYTCIYLCARGTIYYDSKWIHVYYFYLLIDTPTRHYCIAASCTPYSINYAVARNRFTSYADRSGKSSVIAGNKNKKKKKNYSVSNKLVIRLISDLLLLFFFSSPVWPGGDQRPTPNINIGRFLYGNRNSKIPLREVRRIPVGPPRGYLRINVGNLD